MRVRKEHSVSLTVRLHRFLPMTEAEGPGRRACLWVQGCERHCPGCFNQATWDRNAGSLVTVDQLFEWIMEAPAIEGVTFVGGEPFLQAGPLAALGQQCQIQGLSVVTFTGYTLEGLSLADPPHWQALLAVTDLLLAGPYEADKQDFSRPWVGSRNQEFVFLTPKYKHLTSALADIPNHLELRVEANGAVSLNGMASETEIGNVQRRLAELGLSMQLNGASNHDKDNSNSH